MLVILNSLLFRILIKGYILSRPIISIHKIPFKKANPSVFLCGIPQNCNVLFKYLPLPFCVIGILQELQMEKADGFSLNSTITSQLFNNTELQEKGSFECSEHIV